MPPTPPETRTERLGAVVTGLDSFCRELETARSIAEAARLTLGCARALSSSRQGFVGILDPRGDGLHSSPPAGEIWEACEVSDGILLLEGLGTFWGWVLKSRLPLLRNGPADDRGETRTFTGGTPLPRFLAVPALHGRSLVGVVAVADGERDYDVRDQQSVGLLASLLALDVVRRRAEESERECRRQLEATVLGTAEIGEGAPDEADRQRLQKGGESRLLQAINRAAEEWRQTFDSLDTAVLIVDERGAVLRLNKLASAMAGHGFADCIGKRIVDLGTGEPWQSWSGIVRDRPLDAVNYQVRNEETRRWWEVAALRMATREPGPPRFVLSARDVTVVVELEAYVRQSEKLAAMGALTAGVAHQVRNPLFAISASVDALGALSIDQPKVSRLIELMRGEVARMTRLMEDLLAYGRPLSPKALSEEPLSSAVDAAIRSCETHARAAGVSIGRRIEGPPPRVRMDRERLSEVLVNLIENAVQHSPKGGEVVVTLEGFRREKRQWARCLVRDSGPGFAPEDLPMIFEPFFSRRKGGTGLGLAIALKIVDQHGGTICAVNRPGGGAEMIIEIPCSGG